MKIGFGRPVNVAPEDTCGPRPRDRFLAMGWWPFGTFEHRSRRSSAGSAASACGSCGCCGCFVWLIIMFTIVIALTSQNHINTNGVVTNGTGDANGNCTTITIAVANESDESDTIKDTIGESDANESDVSDTSDTIAARYKIDAHNARYQAENPVAPASLKSFDMKPRILWRQVTEVFLHDDEAPAPLETDKLK
jgi:hypothetical protein